MPEVRWHRAAAEIVQLLPEPIADRIVLAARLLGQFPAMGRRVHDPQWPNLRRVLAREGNVVYAYDPVADTVTIVAIVAPGTGRPVK